jgi:hypothetical protein
MTAPTRKPSSKKRAASKPALTAEQKAEKAEARAERVQALTESIEARLHTLSEQLAQGKSDALKAWLGTMAKFHQYSWNNQLLILCQRPEAGMVAGFHRWKELGRSVKKGAKGIAILRPFTVPDRDAPPQADGRPSQKLVGFGFCYVFADCDTDGEGELPGSNFMHVHGDQNLMRQLERFTEQAAEQGIRVDWEQCGATTYGYTDGGRIVLDREKCAAEPGNATRTFFHEWAHIVLHFQGQGKRPEDCPDRHTRELEADACAYVLASHFGLDATLQVSDYVLLWGGSPDKLRASAPRIQRAVAQILRHLDVEAALQDDAVPAAA